MGLACLGSKSGKKQKGLSLFSEGNSGVAFKGTEKSGPNQPVNILPHPPHLVEVLSKQCFLDLLSVKDTIYFLLSAVFFLRFPLRQGLMGGFFQIGPMLFVGAGLVPEMFSKKGFCMAVLFV